MIRRSLPLLLCLLVSPVFAEPVAPQTLYNFVRPTDVVQVIGSDSQFPQSTAEPAADGEILRRLTFNAAPQPSMRLTPQTGIWDWSQAEAMSLRLQNAMGWALTLNVRIESADGQVLTTQVALPPGPAQTLLVPLAASSMRQQGMRAGPPQPWSYNGQRVLLADEVAGALNPAQVSAVTLFLTQPDVPQQILLGRFGVRDLAPVRQAQFNGIVDEYGQYSRGSWPEKISNDGQLLGAVKAEQTQLQAWLKNPPAQDRFGGWPSAQSFEAKGFFRTEKRDGRWYLLSPEGNPFYSLGVNAVSSRQSQTYVQGREAMFLNLPAEGTPLAAYYGSADHRQDTGASKGRAFAEGRWFDFYQANLARSYPATFCAPATVATEPAAAASTAPVAQTPVNQAPACGETWAQQRWLQHSQQRLQAWGFNTLGNWSDLPTAEQQRVAYTLPLLIRGDYATISTGLDWWGGMPDPFDPRFAMATERAVAISSRDHREDPWLIGYFADNELAWAGPGSDPAARYALAYSTLRLTTDVPAKRAFLKQLRDKYRNQQGLSKAWGIELAAWELMEDPGFQAPLPSPEFPAIEKDLQRFQTLFAETYFKTIADSLDWHAPNHMLLGGRFSISTPEAVAACAKYCDVLSFNFYTREPQHGYDFETLRALDKPLLISEFHFGSRDRGPFWGGVAEVPREQDRGPAYAHFLQRALEEPSIVGTHWFQYLDQPVTGRLLDGENGHFGLVGITDRPFQGFVETVRKANLQAREHLLKTLPAPVPAQVPVPAAPAPAATPGEESPAQP